MLVLQGHREGGRLFQGYTVTKGTELDLNLALPALEFAVNPCRFQTQKVNRVSDGLFIDQ